MVGAAVLKPTRPRGPQRQVFVAGGGTNSERRSCTVSTRAHHFLKRLSLQGCFRLCSMYSGVYPSHSQGVTVSPRIVSNSGRKACSPFSLFVSTIMQDFCRSKQIM